MWQASGHAPAHLGTTDHLPPPRLSCPPQAGFKRDLIREVRAFVGDAQAFRREWDASGPMVAGLDPMEAVDRLRKFQQMFEVRAGPNTDSGSCLLEPVWQQASRLTPASKGLRRL